ncbi:MAG: S-methyl-5-thioribose-1-phosphate isomerase [Thermodesulfobacteriota bacterium]
MTEHIFFDPEQNKLVLLDQRYLPAEEKWFACADVDDIVYALQEMVIRGAPAIGVTAAFGCYLAACEQKDGQNGQWFFPLEARIDFLAAARPTAVNLKWAIAHMREARDKNQGLSLQDLKNLWLNMARELLAHDQKINRDIGRLGQTLLASGDQVMTHCNAGALATGGYGTALGVIRGAVEQGKNILVIANETRPFLQGARLTAYELLQDDIPVKVACDNACGLLMRRSMIDKVVVGADRIAVNGDVANKIGTYTVAVMAREHGIPFYVAAPRYTFDLSCPSGNEIPIECRSSTEVTHIGGTRITPKEIEVFNYAFDITPAEYVTAFITEDGVFYPPYNFAD